MRPELLVQGVFSLFAASLYGWVARLVQHRTLSEEARAANTLFATWWGGFALIYGLTGLHQLAAAVGYHDLALTLVYLDAVLVLICVALWGLLGYLLYLYTGSRRWFAPLGVAYAVFAVGLLYVVAWAHPTGYQEASLGVQLAYERQPPQLLSATLGLLIAVPIVGGAIAYGSLYFRVQSAHTRYRVAMVASGFLLWFGWSIVSTLLSLGRRFPNSVPLYLWGQALAVLAPLLVVMAFRPPRWVRERLARAEPGA